MAWEDNDTTRGGCVITKNALKLLLEGGATDGQVHNNFFLYVNTDTKIHNMLKLTLCFIIFILINIHSNYLEY